jgi:hypothetical protein
MKGNRISIKQIDRLALDSPRRPVYPGPVETSSSTRRLAYKWKANSLSTVFLFSFNNRQTAKKATPPSRSLLCSCS